MEFNLFTDLRHPCGGCKFINSIYFCDRIQCRFYCGDKDSATFQVCLERYYARKYEAETDYMRSDIDVTQQVDRVIITNEYKLDNININI